MRTIARFAAILGGAVSACSCATSYGTATEPTPAAAADAGLATATEAGAVGHGEAPPDAQAFPTVPFPCPSKALLCDAFEDRGGSTDLAGTRWGVLAGAGAGRIDATIAFSPGHSLAIDVPAGTTGNALGLGAFPTVTATGVTLRAAVRISSLPPYAQLFAMVADIGFFALIVDNGKLVAQYSNGSGSAWVKTAIDCPVDRWFRVAFVLGFGPKGGVELLIDDVSVHKAAAATTSAAAVSNFTVIVQPAFGGNAVTATTQPITLHYDDIVLE